MEIWLTWIYHHNLTQRIFMKNTLGCWSLLRYHSSRWPYYWGTAPPVFHQPTLLTSYFAEYFWQILDDLGTTCGFTISSNIFQHIQRITTSPEKEKTALPGSQEDSLARQLRALKEAKQLAASELAKSEKQIAQRQAATAGILLKV